MLLHLFLSVIKCFLSGVPARWKSSTVHGRRDVLWSIWHQQPSVTVVLYRPHTWIWMGSMAYTQIQTTRMNHGTAFAGWERTDAWTEQLEVYMKTVKHRWTRVADLIHLVFCRAEELSK